VVVYHGVNPSWSFLTTFVQATIPRENIPSRATATSAGGAEHDGDMLGDERQLKEVPSMSKKGMQRSRSRYDGWTLAGRIDRCDGSLVP
jgi:hypothetical protein